MNTRFYGIGRVGVAWRDYRRPTEPRWFGVTEIGLPFDPEPYLRVRQLRLGPLVVAVVVR